MRTIQSLALTLERTIALPVPIDAEPNCAANVFAGAGDDEGERGHGREWLMSPSSANLARAAHKVDERTGGATRLAAGSAKSFLKCASSGTTTSVSVRGSCGATSLGAGRRFPMNRV